MYPIMGGQLTDFYRALRDAFNTYEQMEQARRHAELFRQHQEQYGGRAVSAVAQAEAEHLFLAYNGQPPQQAQDQWSKKWGMPWSTVSGGFKPGETRQVERAGRASIEADLRHVREFVQKSINGIYNDAQLMNDPKRKAAAIQTVKNQAASWFDIRAANPDIAGDPSAILLIERGKQDILNSPLLSITPPVPGQPTLPPAPVFPAAPATPSQPSVGLGGLGPGPGGIGLGERPRIGLSGGQPGLPNLNAVDPAQIEMLINAVRQAQQQPGTIIPGEPIYGPYGGGPQRPSLPVPGFIGR